MPVALETFIVIGITSSPIGGITLPVTSSVVHVQLGTALRMRTGLSDVLRSGTSRVTEDRGSMKPSITVPGSATIGPAIAGCACCGMPWPTCPCFIAWAGTPEGPGRG